MIHALATKSLHDGGGIFTLAWSLVMTPVSIAIIFNYRQMAERQYWRGGVPMSPHLARIVGGIFFVSGLLCMGFAINRFVQGGY